MADKILIDTNVLLDYLLEREPFFEDAKKVILLCAEGNAQGCIAAHSISNMFFILRKDYTAKERREILSNLCTIFEVEGIDKAKLLSGLANEEFSDFEDCLQME
ncbi:MAG: PIN domain-containing protein [[Bacteroides] pectinophilus]|nr:PIN domain-containing protein [[Bacteroides] pectinophilus]